MIKQLFELIQEVNKEGIAQLLSQGTITRHNINSASYDSCTPLMLAAKLGSLDTVNLLIKHGAEVNASIDAVKGPLTLAAENGHINIVRLLLDHGAQVRHECLSNVKDEEVKRLLTETSEIIASLGV